MDAVPCGRGGVVVPPSRDLLGTAAPVPIPPVRGEGGSDTGAVRGEGEDSAMVCDCNVVYALCAVLHAARYLPSLG